MARIGAHKSNTDVVLSSADQRNTEESTLPSNDLPQPSTSNVIVRTRSRSKRLQTEEQVMIENNKNPEPSAVKGHSTSTLEPNDESKLSTSNATASAQISSGSNPKRRRTKAKLPLNINATPDDALRLILQRLTLQEQIHLRIISRRWKVIIEQICAGKQSLKLFNGKDAITEYYNKAQDLLPVEPVLQLSPAGQFNDDLVLNSDILEDNIRDNEKYIQRNRDSQFLIDLFPAITSLTISVKPHYFIPSIDSVFKFNFANLLRQWPALTTLIITNFPASARVPRSAYNSPRLYQQEGFYWKAISELPSLTSLYILGTVTEADFDIKNLRWRTVDNVDMTFAPVALALSRLQQFTYFNDTEIFNVRYFLEHLKSCTKLRLFMTDTSVGGGIQMKTKSIFPIYTALNLDHLTANLTHLQMVIRFQDDAYLDYICNHFKALTVLEDELWDAFEWNDEKPAPPFGPTVRQLAKLTKLTELRMTFNAQHLFPAVLEKLPALSSITTLYMNITVNKKSKCFPSAQSYKTLQHVFPNLESAFIFCDNERIRGEAENCFTITRFPKLKKAACYRDTLMMFPVEARYKYMAERENILFKR